MIPTSRHSLTAVNILSEIEMHHKTKMKIFYTQFRTELCKTIVQLCAANQILVNNTLLVSLKKVVVHFGYLNTKDFVAQECECMLRFLIPLVATMPRVKELIVEIADLVEMELSQLLISKYKGIFLYVYLEEPENVCNESMKYLERETGMSGSMLRKNNFRMLLNELLLNFHINHERALQLLKLLLEENSQEMDIQDYLQPLLLGVLLNFDRKLEKQSERKDALLSLIELFRLVFLLVFFLATICDFCSLQIYWKKEFECNAF